MPIFGMDKEDDSSENVRVWEDLMEKVREATAANHNVEFVFRSNERAGYVIVNYMGQLLTSAMDKNLAEALKMVLESDPVREILGDEVVVR